MKKKNLFVVLALVVLAVWGCSKKATVPAAPQKSLSAKDVFIDSLMAQMTLEEKVGQLNLPSIGFDVTGPLLSEDVEGKIRKGLVGGVFNSYTPVAVRRLQDIAVKETRLKIPLLFGYDVIHGHRTIFPIPLGLSASWDMNLVERTARAAALEASADGLNWTFSPMVDIARDPRWGRVSEGAGEDVHLGSRIAEAMVRGYQGKDFSSPTHIMACIKHFALYGAAEAGRDYNTVDMSLQRMYNEYFPPYKAGLDAGAATVMSSFNEINGTPATGNRWLMHDVLRRDWGFKGFVVTDYTAINEMIQHGVGDGAEVARLSIEAPVEMDMVGELFITHLPQLVKDGKVSEQTVNNACRLILEAKWNLGLFKDPYRFINDERSKTEMMSADKIALAKEAAVKSMVLLKNTNATLPLKPVQKVAFIGPLIKDKRNLIGNWSGAGDWRKAKSMWEALVEQGWANEKNYALGCNLLENEALIKRLNDHDGMIVRDTKSPQTLIEEAVALAKQSDVAVVALGEAFGMSGEAASRSDIELPENQRQLLLALKETGVPIVLVLMNGRPLALEWENQHCAAILETWFAGTAAGDAIVEVLTGKQNPSGKLTMTFPRNVGQIPIYYNAKNTGRPFDAGNKYTSKYLDVDNTPLYPFGYGLSYTSFSYSNVKLSATSVAKGGTIQVSATVTNTGSMEGDEVVQFYIHDKVRSLTPPKKELKHFERLTLKAGESKEVKWTITEKDLSFWNSSLQWVAEPGEFELFVGGSSDIPVSATFTRLP
jgi:beta-glucosidase